jgi:hypothetical protein
MIRANILLRNMVTRILMKVKKGIVSEKLTNLALNKAFQCVFQRKYSKYDENTFPQKFLSLGGREILNDYYICFFCVYFLTLKCEFSPFGSVVASTLPQNRPYKLHTVIKFTVFEKSKD